MPEIITIKHIIITLVQVNLFWSAGFLFIRYLSQTLAIENAYRLVLSYHYSLALLLLILYLKPNSFGVTIPIISIRTPISEINGQAQTFWNFETVFILFLGLIVIYSISVGALRILKLLTIRHKQLSSYHSLLESVKAELNFSGQVYLVTNTHSKSVGSFRLFRSIILVPDQFLEKLSEQEQRFVILHELIHLKYHDFQYNILQKIVVMLFAYNPLVWISNRLIDLKRELRCDNQLLALDKYEPDEYGKFLFRIYELSTNKPLDLAVGISGSQSEILQRIHQIIHPINHRRYPGQFVIALMLILSTLSFAVLVDFEKEALKKSTNEKISGSVDVFSYLEADTKPRIVKQIPISYPESARQNKIEADVVIQLIVNTSGQATDIQVLKGHPALNEAAINAVSHYEFSPAIVAGKRVPVKWQIPIRFRIES